MRPARSARPSPATDWYLSPSNGVVPRGAQRPAALGTPVVPALTSALRWLTALRYAPFGTLLYGAAAALACCEVSAAMSRSDSGPEVRLHSCFAPSVFGSGATW